MITALIVLIVIILIVLLIVWYFIRLERKRFEEVVKQKQSLFAKKIAERMAEHLHERAKTDDNIKNLVQKIKNYKP